jgi:hypothetical protein
MYAADVTERDLPATFTLRTDEGHVTVDEEWREILRSAGRTLREWVTDRIATSATFG